MKHRRLFPVLFTLLLTQALLCGACASAQTLTCIVPDGQYVNVRKQPSSTASAWGIMHGGETIETDPADIADGFFKTTFGDRTAYVSVKYFEIDADEQCVVEANGRVRTRSSPGGEATGFVQPGATVRVTAWRYAADGSKWAKCTGKKFIAAEYLKPAENAD